MDYENNNINSNEQLNENKNQLSLNDNTISSNQKYEEPIDRNIFHKKKKDYNIFTINPEVEEIPTFTFENDRNLNSYKGRINNKYNQIEQYSKNYLEYMKRFENKRKTPFASPFLVYQEKTRGNKNNIFNQFDNNYMDKQNKTIDVDSYSIKGNQNLHNNYDINQNNKNNDINDEDVYNQNSQIQKNRSRNNILANSGNIFNFSSRNGEITNPDFYFQRNNQDYYKYRLEQKKYLDYNYEIIKNRLNKRDKREPDINPYNPINNQIFEKGKSDLLHNPILNPINNYSYNKYLEKEVNLGNRYTKSSNDIINSNKNIYKRNSYNFSTLQQAGNQLLNN